MEVDLDIKQIMKILPHRYPFLLVDRIIEIEAGKRAVGLKNVTMNECHFPGHFPGHPVMPGVLIVEAMAQVGGVVLLSLPEATGKLAYFTGIDHVRFRRMVFPGDQLRITVEVLKTKGLLCKMKVQATVENEIAAEGELMCSLGEADTQTKGVSIHPTAIVHPCTQLGVNVAIGPNVIIGENVVIGDGTSIEANSIICKNTRIGKNCKIYCQVSIANPPQDLRYKAEKNQVVIGNNNVIRELVTIHLPVGEGKETVVGNDNFIMIAAHIPHNCRMGNGIIIGGYVGLAGYAIIEDMVIVGGMVGIHQFVRIGKMAMVGGHSKIVQDVPPFMLADGNPSQIRGVNSVGLQRRKVSSAAQNEIKKAYKILYKSGFNSFKALEEIKKLYQYDEIKHLVDFLSQESARGIIRKLEEAETIEAEELIFPEIPELGI